jgi:hypothetical protein
MARPTKLTRQVTTAICEAVRAGVQFEQACWSVGIAASTAFEWRARGEGRDPRRPATSPYVEFAEAVARAEGAAWRDDAREELAEPPEQSEDGQADSFADAQSNGETTSDEGFAEGEPFSEFSESVTRASAEAEPADETGTERLEEFADGFSDTTRDRARAREEEADEEPRRAPMPWLSKRSRGELSIFDLEF